MSKFMTDPTFTWQEFVYSFVPWEAVPTNVEEMGYLTAKGYVSMGPLMIRWMYLMSTGMGWEAAGYATTQNSLGFYRMMSKGRNIATVATNPLLAAGVLAGASAYYVHTSPPPTEAHRSEPGQTSWWRAVAQAMTGTGPGIGGANIGI